MKSKNIYSLPFKKDITYLAVSDSEAHYSFWKHAIDFSIGFNVPILAPLDGEVWNVKDDSKEGGRDDKYMDWKYQNIITIKHPNDEYSQFAHLAHKSALVKIGDKVKRGQSIAKGIGITGCTTSPHLHMMVCIITDKKKDEYESLRIRFDKKFKIIRDAKEHVKELKRLKVF